MTYTLVKVAVSALLIVAISEIAKRSTLFGGLVASLPITSLLAFIWLYVDTGDAARVAALSSSILWLVLPSLVLFLAFPLLVLKLGLGFWPSLGIACAATAAAYGAMLAAARWLGYTL